MKDRVIDIMMNNPWKCFFISLVCILGIMSGASQMGVDFTYRVWFQENDQNLKKFDSFEEKFGNDDELVIVYHNEKGVFTPEAAKVITGLTDELWKIKDIIKVSSLSNFKYVYGRDEELVIEDLISNDETKLTVEYLAERKKITESEKLVPGLLMGYDGKSALIIGKLRPGLEDVPNYPEIVASVNTLVDGYKTEHSNFYLTGGPAIDVAFATTSEKDIKGSFPILMGLIMLSLFLFFRKWSGVLLPFLIMLMAIPMTYGIAGLIDIRFNALTAAIPNIILAISIADVVHILSTYFQKLKSGLDKENAIKQTYLKNLFPTFLTTISTALGFFSLAFSEIVPIANMGILAGVGVIFIWVLTVFFLGPILVLLPGKKKKVFKQKLLSDFDWVPYVNFIQSNKVTIISFSLIFTLGMLISAFYNSINSNPFNAFTEEVPIKQADNYVKDHIGASLSIEVVLDAKKTEGIKDPVFLKKVEQFQTWLNERAYVPQTMSLIDILKSTNKALYGNDEKYYAINDDPKSISEQIFIYSLSLPQGEDLNHLITLDNRYLRINAKWKISDSNKSLKTIALIEDKISEFGLTGEITGKTPLMNNMLNQLVETFFISITSAIVLISILMIIVAGSFKIGFLSLLPNLLPVISVLGVLTWTGFSIDVGSVMVVSICLGIVVDDTIHFMSNYIANINSGLDEKSAIQNIMSDTVPAMIITSVVLILGFGSFVFASFIPNIALGFSTCVALIVALVADLFLLPAILIRKQSERISRTQEIPEANLLKMAKF